MRALVAFAIVALLAVPSYAQEAPSGKRHHGREQKPEQNKKSDDKGYGSALSRIPNQKADPWRDMR
jgi:hypothetical protein